MYIRIHQSKDYQTGNTGSCSGLISYLEKENEVDGLELEDRRLFFDQNQEQVSSFDAITRIDKNVAKLSKNEARFYMISINPSQKEQEFLARKITGRQVSSPEEMTKKELEKFDASLRNYTRQVMDVYADNFNRGLSGDDLLYYGKVEHERKYNRFDEVVKNRERKAGDLKEGFQCHVHVVVSRKDATNKIRLSPFANHKNSKNVLNGEKVQIGFNRKEFVQRSEKKFDEYFGYNRQLSHSFKYRYELKNGAAAIARSYANQLTGGAYFKVYNASRNMKNMKEDPLKSLTSLFYKNSTFRNTAKTIQMAARPEKLLIEVAKKLPNAISKSAGLKL